MSKRFIAKRKRQFKYKYILYLLIIYLFISIIINLLFDGIKVSNENNLGRLLPQMTYLDKRDYSVSIINSMISIITNDKLKEPHLLLSNCFVHLVDTSGANEGLIIGVAYNDDYSDFEKLQTITDYMPDPNPQTILNPRVYIYNSHQIETYQMTNQEIYNITPNVMLASYILRENLNKLGVPTIVDETNLVEFMRVNNWPYSYSYKASRMPLKEAIEKYDTLEYFIDIHRDSIKKTASTIVIDNVTYARTLFVVGLEHKNYEGNLKLARELHNQIEQKYPGLSRGVLTKKGSGVNGIYNQDLSPNIMLLEIGGVDNTIDEVANTTEVMAQIIFNYIKGD
jgi:stage II sporulation protein P